jgi:hypothetical protein
MSKKRPLRALLALAAPLGFLAWGCTGAEREPATRDEARLDWQQPDSTTFRVFYPTDMAAIGADGMWVVDAPVGGVYWVSPPVHRYLMMGIGDRPPTQIHHPARIAMSPDVGMFTYDLETKRVDHFTFDGQFLGGFEPGFQPSLMAVVHDPVGLEYAVTTPGPDSTSTLTVIRTDLRGESPDTLLSTTRGPEPLRKASAKPDSLALASCRRGIWVWARGSVPDTVFEMSERPDARKLLLRPEDRDAVGLLCDTRLGLLWTVGADTARIRYAAYDISGRGVLRADSTFLGERTTPVGFTPHVAIDGRVLGWVLVGRNDRLATAFDMRVDELRR